MRDRSNGRAFLAGVAAVAGSTASLPANEVAELHVSQLDRAGQPAALDVNDRLNVCLEQLMRILAEIHPDANAATHHINSQDDGGFELFIQGRPTFEAFSGDGFYLVSERGWLSPFYLQQVIIKNSAGKIVAEHFWGYQWIDRVLGKALHGLQEDLSDYFGEAKYFGAPSIVRALPMPSGVTLSDVPLRA